MYIDDQTPGTLSLQQKMHLVPYEIAYLTKKGFIVVPDKPHADASSEVDFLKVLVQGTVANEIVWTEPDNFHFSGISKGEKTISVTLSEVTDSATVTVFHPKLGGARGALEKETSVYISPSHLIGTFPGSLRKEKHDLFHELKREIRAQIVRRTTQGI